MKPFFLCFRNLCCDGATFFKTGAGAYGEGDRFIGVRVPEVRKIARDFAPKLSPEEVLPLLRDTVHECRLLALLVWVQQFPKETNVFEKKSFRSICRIRRISIIGIWSTFRLMRSSGFIYKTRNVRCFINWPEKVRFGNSAYRLFPRGSLSVTGIFRYVAVGRCIALASARPYTEGCRLDVA